MSMRPSTRRAASILVLLVLIIHSGVACSLLPPKVTGLVIAAPPPTLAHGGTYQLGVTAVLSNGQTRDVTAQAAGTTYTVSNGGAVSVSANGLLTISTRALTGEGCVIVARNGDVSAEVTVTVRNTLSATARSGADGVVQPSNLDLLDVVVNKGRSLPADYVPADLVVPDVRFSFSEAADKRLLRADAAVALGELFASAGAAGYQLAAVSGYRSYATQATIFQRNVSLYGLAAASRFSARPGQSEHQTGLAMDVSSASVGYRLTEEFASTAEGRWLAAHAHEYGFVIRYPADGESITGYAYEPWHLRYLGRDLATAVRQQGITLEEFFGDVVFGRPGRPAVTIAEARLTETEPNGGVLRGTKVLTPGREEIVGIDDLVLSLQFDPLPTAEWYAANLKFTGATPRLIDANLGMGLAEWVIPRGSAGDRLTLKVTSVASPSMGSTLEYPLVRQAEPVGTMQVQAATGGQWVDVAPSDSLVGRPLKLRLSYTKDMDRATVEAAVRAAAPDVVGLVWSTARTLELTIPVPAPALRIATMDMRDTDGLWVRGGLPVVFTSGPARLMALRPGDEAPTTMATVPAHVFAAALRPDGKVLAVNYVAEVTGGVNAGTLVGPWLIDTATGAITKAARSATVLAWAGTNLVALDGDTWLLIDQAGKVVREIQAPEEGLSLHSVSPDGSRLAALRFRFDDQAADDYTVATDLIIVQLATATVTRIESIVETYLPPQEWIVSARPVWSPDGAQLVLVHDASRSAGEVRVLDIATGQVTRLRAADAVQGPPTTAFLSWSPDGQWLAHGNTLYKLDGGATRTLTGGDKFARHHWSADSTWLAQSDPWSKARLFEIGAGSMRDLGRTYGLGWSPDGRFIFIDWPDSEHRRGEYWMP